MALQQASLAVASVFTSMFVVNVHGGSRIKYSNPKAYGYAKKYCQSEDNECGVFLSGQNKSDCAHFIAHCLNAGGIVIKNSDPQTKFCPQGLAVRNPVIVDSLRQLATRFENIKEIDLSDTIVGDVGFLTLDRPRHAFMVCKPGQQPGNLNVPFVWAHSSARCCEQLDTNWRQWFSTAFRLEDGVE